MPFSSTPTSDIFHKQTENIPDIPTSSPLKAQQTNLANADCWNSRGSLHSYRLDLIFYACLLLLEEYVTSADPSYEDFFCGL